MVMGGEYTLTIEASLDHLDEVRRFVEESVKDTGLDSSKLSDLILAVDEAVTNIVVHGYQRKPGKLEVNIENTDDSVRVHLKDQAPKFDPLSHLSLSLEATIKKDTPGGFGLHMIKRITDDLEYKVDNSGRNVLSLIKHY